MMTMRVNVDANAETTNKPKQTKKTRRRLRLPFQDIQYEGNDDEDDETDDASDSDCSSHDCNNNAQFPGYRQ